MQVQEILESKSKLLAFLKEKGFQEEKKYSDDEYSEGTYFKLDNRKLLVVYKLSDEERLKEVKDHFLIDRGLCYCIIILDNKLIFFRNFGETKYFIYSKRTCENPSKVDKLKNIESFDSLFQSKDISALFYETFKTKRDLLVQNIKNDAEPVQKYLIAQKLFDRFFFIYFICHKGIIKFKDGRNISGETLFTKILLQKGVFLNNLKQLFHLFNTQEKNILNIGDYQVIIPYLNGGLFRPDILEKDLDIGLNDKQWKDIFDFLNSYHWIIEDVKATEEYEEKILTPEILGHVYERSVVEWESEGFENEAENAIKKISERKKKGVYYTPEIITDYISNNTIIPFLLGKLVNRYSSFDDLVLSKNKKDIKDALQILNEIKILDPACGSGAFLIKASDIIFGLKRRLYYVLKEKNDYYNLRLGIITNNIYGVDILSGAVEISKLRLWLWLISDYDSKSEVEPLPNIEYNLMQGNSLIGFTSFKGKLIEVSKKIEEETLRFEELKKEYKISHGKKSDLLRQLLEKEMKIVRNELNTLFVKDLNSRGLTNFKTKKEIQFNFFGKQSNNHNNYIYVENFEKACCPFHWVLEFSEVFLRNEQGFDVIIGNPPYGDSVFNDLEMSIFRCLQFKTLKVCTNDGGSKNGASLFIERSTQLLNNMGYFSFIVPNSVGRVKQFEKIRLMLLSDVNLIEIVDEGKPFKDVTLEMISLFYNKQERKKDVLITINREGLPISLEETQFKVDKNIFIKYKQFIIYHDNLFDKIFDGSTINVFDAVRGGDLEFKDSQNSKYCIPHLYSGKSIHEYYIDLSEISYTTKDELKNETANNAYKNELIASTKIYPYPRAIIKPKGYTIGAGVVKIDVLNQLINNKYALAILNSKLIKYVCYRYLVNLSQLTTNLNTGQLPLIPVKIIKKDKQIPLIKLVNKIMDITKSDDYLQNSQKIRRVTLLQERIDNLIYDIYNLNSDNVRVIEDFYDKMIKIN